MKTLNDIIDLSYEDFVKELKELVDDPKIQAILNSGNNEKIKFSSGTIPANKLIPMQKELILEESIGHAISGTDMKFVEDVIEGKPILILDKPVITLNGKYIIDGHHRWVECYGFNPNARMIVYDMKLNIQPIEVLKIMQLAIAATNKDIPFSKPDGTNIYTAKINVLYDYIYDNLIEDVFLEMGYEYSYNTYPEYYQSGQEIKNNPKDSATSFIVDNLQLLIKNNQPIPGAPSRIIMPQVSKAPDSTKKLQQGDVAYKKPFNEGCMTFDNFLSLK